MCVCVCVCTPGDFRFKWVKVRLASYYCLHSRSYIITVNCNMDREGEGDRTRDCEEGGQKETDAAEEKQRARCKRDREGEKAGEREDEERETTVGKKSRKSESKRTSEANEGVLRVHPFI